VAAAGTRWIASLLFGVTAGDGVTVAVAVLGMLATGAVASYLPARRATRIDAMMALRHERGEGESL